MLNGLARTYGVAKGISRTIQGIGDPKRRKKQRTLKKLGWDEIYSPSDFSSARDIKKTYRRLHRKRRKEKRKTRRKKRRRSQSSSSNSDPLPFPMMPYQYPMPYQHPMQPRSALPEPAARPLKSLAAVPKEVIDNPPVAFGLFQDSVRDLAIAYGSDPNARIDTYRNSIANARRLQIQAELESPDKTLLKVTVGSLQEIENGLTENEKMYDQKWKELGAERKLLDRRYVEECQAKTETDHLAFLFQQLDGLNGKNEPEYKQKLDQIRTMINKCSTSTQGQMEETQFRLKKMLEKLKSAEADVPKKAETKKGWFFGGSKRSKTKTKTKGGSANQTESDSKKLLKEQIEKIEELIASGSSMDASELTETIEEAEAVRLSVLNEERKAESKNLAHLGEVSPYYKAAGYLALAAGIGLAVGAATIGLDRTLALPRQGFAGAQNYMFQKADDAAVVAAQSSAAAAQAVQQANAAEGTPAAAATQQVADAAVADAKQAAVVAEQLKTEASRIINPYSGPNLGSVTGQLAVGATAPQAYVDPTVPIPLGGPMGNGLVAANQPPSYTSQTVFSGPSSFTYEGQNGMQKADNYIAGLPPTNDGANGSPVQLAIEAPKSKSKSKTKKSPVKYDQQLLIAPPDYVNSAVPIGDPMGKELVAAYKQPSNVAPLGTGQVTITPSYPQFDENGVPTNNNNYYMRDVRVPETTKEAVQPANIPQVDETRMPTNANNYMRDVRPPKTKMDNKITTKEAVQPAISYPRFNENGNLVVPHFMRGSEVPYGGLMGKELITGPGIEMEPWRLNVTPTSTMDVRPTNATVPSITNATQLANPIEPLELDIIKPKVTYDPQLLAAAKDQEVIDFQFKLDAFERQITPYETIPFGQMSVEYMEKAKDELWYILSEIDTFQQTSKLKDKNAMKQVQGLKKRIKSLIRRMESRAEKLIPLNERAALRTQLPKEFPNLPLGNFVQDSDDRNFNLNLARIEQRVSYFERIPIFAMAVKDLNQSIGELNGLKQESASLKIPEEDYHAAAGHRSQVERKIDALISSMQVRVGQIPADERRQKKWQKVHEKNAKKAAEKAVLPGLTLGSDTVLRVLDIKLDELARSILPYDSLNYETMSDENLKKNIRGLYTIQGKVITLIKKENSAILNAPQKDANEINVKISNINSKIDSIGFRMMDVENRRRIIISNEAQRLEQEIMPYENVQYNTLPSDLIRMQRELIKIRARAEALVNESKDSDPEIKSKAKTLKNKVAKIVTGISEIQEAQKLQKLEEAKRAEAERLKEEQSNARRTALVPYKSSTFIPTKAAARAEDFKIKLADIEQQFFPYENLQYNTMSRQELDKKMFEIIPFRADARKFTDQWKGRDPEIESKVEAFQNKVAKIMKETAEIRQTRSDEEKKLRSTRPTRAGPYGQPQPVSTIDLHQKDAYKKEQMKHAKEGEELNKGAFFALPVDARRFKMDILSIENEVNLKGELLSKGLSISDLFNVKSDLSTLKLQLLLVENSFTASKSNINDPEIEPMIRNLNTKIDNTVQRLNAQSSKLLEEEQRAAKYQSIVARYPNRASFSHEEWVKIEPYIDTFETSMRQQEDRVRKSKEKEAKSKNIFTNRVNRNYTKIVKDENYKLAAMQNMYQQLLKFVPSASLDKQLKDLMINLDRLKDYKGY